MSDGHVRKLFTKIEIVFSAQFSKKKESCFSKRQKKTKQKILKNE